MGNGSRGTDETALLYGDVARSQAHNQVVNQLGKISRALLVTKSNAGKLLVLFAPRHPVFDDKASATLQYSRHSFLWRRKSNFTSEHPIVDEISECLGLEGLHDDFIRFQKDGVHRTLQVGVAADQQRQCLWLDVAHRGNHCKAVAGVRHVEISDQDIEALCGDQLQSLCHVGRSDNGETLVFKSHSHHVADGVVVIHKQDLVGNSPFVQSHKHSLSSRTKSSVTQVYCGICSNANSYKDG